jgi:hypothetical protein
VQPLGSKRLISEKRRRNYDEKERIDYLVQLCPGFFGIFIILVVMGII